MEVTSPVGNLEDSDADVSGIISELLHNRQVNGRPHTPIVFLGHSLGGNVLKQVFVATHPTRDRDIRIFTTVFEPSYTWAPRKSRCST